MFIKLCRLMEWILDTFVALFVCRQQEAANDAKQKAAQSPEDSEESPNAAQVCLVFVLAQLTMT
jgi:hypothetical protein